MKIEKLNENKIKITFNIDDLEGKNIDLYSFMHNTPETQDLFWDILNEAEKECGFNVDNSMIYVEASTSGAGNFVLIVTKTNEKPNSTLTQAINNTFKKKNFKLKRKAPAINLEENIYMFETFDDICDFVKIINIKNADNDSLYTMNNKYYLKSSKMPFNCILEYASILKSPKFVESKLKEYGNILIEENALQTIYKYFNKKNKNLKIKDF